MRHMMRRPILFWLLAIFWALFWFFLLLVVELVVGCVGRLLLVEDLASTSCIMKLESCILYGWPA